MRRLGRYIWNILVALDQLLNAVLAGDPDETVSSRLGRRALAGRLTQPERAVVWCLDKLHHNHVFWAMEDKSDARRAMLSAPRFQDDVKNERRD